MQRWITEKAASLGAVIGALACPICFPKIAVIGAAVGLGVLAPFEGDVAKGVQALFLIAFIGQLIAFRQHGPLVVGTVAPHHCAAIQRLLRRAIKYSAAALIVRACHFQRLVVHRTAPPLPSPRYNEVMLPLINPAPFFWFFPLFIVALLIGGGAFFFGVVW